MVVFIFTQSILILPMRCIFFIHCQEDGSYIRSDIKVSWDFKVFLGMWNPTCPLSWQCTCSVLFCTLDHISYVYMAVTIFLQPKAKVQWPVAGAIIICFSLHLSPSQQTLKGQHLPPSGTNPFLLLRKSMITKKWKNIFQQYKLNSHLVLQQVSK